MPEAPASVVQQMLRGGQHWTCTSCDENNLVTPVDYAWAKEQTSLIAIQPRVPF
jgi:hypothetical protein